MAFAAEALGLGHGAATFAPAGFRGGKTQRAHLVPLNRLSRFGIEAVENGDRVLPEPGEVALAAQLANEAGGVPGAAVRELRLFDEQHVLRTGAPEMIGERSA